MRDALLLMALRHLLLPVHLCKGQLAPGGQEGPLTAALLFLPAMHGSTEAFQ